MLSTLTTQKKHNIVGEQRNLFPLVLDIFEKKRSELQGLVNIVNDDLRFYRYDKKFYINFEDLRQKTILSILHKAPKVINEFVVDEEVDKIIEPITENTREAEETPVKITSAQRKFKKIQVDLPEHVREIVAQAFRLNNLEDVAWELCTSLDQIFSALRFFERKMLAAQEKPISRDIKASQWRLVNDSQREALACELAGFDRNQTAKHLGNTNRTLTNKFIEIRNLTGLSKQDFVTLKTRTSNINIDRASLVNDRLINLVIDKKDLGKEDSKKAAASDPFLFALGSLSSEEISSSIKGIVDYLPERLRNIVLKYVNDDALHVNASKGFGEARLLGFAKTHIKRHLKALLLEETPVGLNKFKWAMFKNSKIRAALRLYLQGHSNARINMLMKTDTPVELLWRWRQDFMNEFDFPKDKLSNLRFRNKIKRAKLNKTVYRKRAFNIIFPKGVRKPKKLKSESQDAYYERIFSLVNKIATLYPRKDTYGYFKHRILGLSANELGSMYGITKSSPISSIKNFANFIRNKIYELDKLSVPKQVDPLNWLEIDESHRLIMKAYLELKESSSSNLYQKLKEFFPGYSVKQLQSITHQGRQKIGMKLLQR